MKNNFRLLFADVSKIHKIYLRKTSSKTRVIFEKKRELIKRCKNEWFQKIFVNTDNATHYSLSN